jgi:hypothetical protein
LPSVAAVNAGAFVPSVSAMCELHVKGETYVSDAKRRYTALRSTAAKLR